MNSPSAIIVLATLFLTSCVAPLSHTYFIPNTNDGKPVRTSSCGFFKNNEDSLERKIGDLNVTVMPKYFSDGKLTVTFFLLYSSASIAFDPDKVEVLETTKRIALQPINKRVSSYGPDRTHPYTLSVTLFFSATATDIDSLKVIARPGALSVGGREIILEPYRFKQRTSTDLYYASINC